MIGIAVGALAIVFTLIITAIACTAGEDIESPSVPAPVIAPAIEEDHSTIEMHVNYLAWLSGHGGDVEWAEYHADAYEEYAAEFTALFNSYETRTAKNGATMIRKGNTGSFKFARKS